MARVQPPSRVPPPGLSQRSPLSYFSFGSLRRSHRPHCWCRQSKVPSQPGQIETFFIFNFDPGHYKRFHWSWGIPTVSLVGTLGSYCAGRLWYIWCTVGHVEELFFIGLGDSKRFQCWILLRAFVAAGSVRFRSGLPDSDSPRVPICVRFTSNRNKANTGTGMQHTAKLPRKNVK